MQKVLLLALFCLAVVSAQKGNSKKLWWTDTKATLLKSGSFLEHVGKDKIVVVQFIAQFSRECQALFPEWEKLALMYQGNSAKRNDVTVALIDGWTFNSISQSYGVTAFPSIIIFGKGDAQTQTVYKGERKAEKMSEWIEKFANGEIPAGQNAEPAGAAPVDTQSNQPADNNAAQNNQPADNNAQPNQPDANNAAQAPPAQDRQAPKEPEATPPPKEPQAAAPTDNAQAPPPQAAPQEPPAQQAPPVQQPPPVQQAPAQPAEPKDVNVVLDTTLLKAQFDELQRHTSALNAALQQSINENFQRLEEFKSLLNSHKQDLTTVGNNVLSHIPKFDEVKQVITNQKDEIHKSVTSHTQQQVDELKTTVNLIKNRVFENRVEEPKESSGFGSSTVMFLVGGLIGAAVTFVIVSAAGGKNKRKYLID